MKKKEIVEKYRGDGIRCGVESCEFWSEEKDTQGCVGQNGAGDPAVANCKKYIPDVIESHFVTKDFQIMSPSEICHQTQLQNCGCCDFIECCDNMSPAKKKIERLGSAFDKMHWRLKNGSLGDQQLASDALKIIQG